MPLGMLRSPEVLAPVERNPRVKMLLCREGPFVMRVAALLLLMLELEFLCWN